MIPLTNFEWNILDSLTDDEETVALILGLIKNDFPKTSQNEVAETVYKLYQRGLVLEDNNKVVDFHTLLNESADYLDNVYWFGLTEIGGTAWEENAKIYSGENIDWSRAWRGKLNFENQIGQVEGTSKEACLLGMEKIDINDTWQIDRATIVFSAVEGFQAKYFKYISGGQMMNFKLKKRCA
jgi:hypothetical protein